MNWLQSNTWIIFVLRRFSYWSLTGCSEAVHLHAVTEDEGSQAMGIRCKIWTKSMAQTSASHHSWLRHHCYATCPQRFPGIIGLHLIFTGWSSAAGRLQPSGQLWCVSVILQRWPVACEQFSIIMFGSAHGSSEGYTVGFGMNDLISPLHKET